MSPELKKKYDDERARRRYISNWAYAEAQKTAATKDPIWMTGDIPNGISIGEDGRGHVTHNTGPNKDDESLRLPGEGLASMPDSLRREQAAWYRKEQDEKRAELEKERQRLREIAEKEGSL